MPEGQVSEANGRQRDRRRTASRRGLLEAGLLAAATILGGCATSQQKLSWEAAQYQDQAKDGRRCDGCIYWVAPHSCRIVAGRISPKGWCAYYIAKRL